MKAALDGWKEAIEEGHKYLRTADKGRARQAVFTPQILHQMACMSIERFCMGFFMQRGYMAEDHTLGGLMKDVKKFTDIDEALVGELSWMQGFEQGMCSMAPTARPEPQVEDVDRFAETAMSVRDLLLPQMKE